MAEWEHMPCGTVVPGNGKKPPEDCTFCIADIIHVTKGRTKAEGWRLVSRKHLEQKPRRPRSRGKRTPSKRLRERVYARDEHRCVICSCEDKELLTTDHKVPWSKGGLTTFENLQTMCRPCNTAKGSRLADWSD